MTITMQKLHLTVDVQIIMFGSGMSPEGNAATNGSLQRLPDWSYLHWTARVTLSNYTKIGLVPSRRAKSG